MEGRFGVNFLPSNDKVQLFSKNQSEILLVVSYCLQIKVESQCPFNFAGYLWGYLWSICQLSNLFSCDPWNDRILSYTEYLPVF